MNLSGLLQGLEIKCLFFGKKKCSLHSTLTLVISEFTKHGKCFLLYFYLLSPKISIIGIFKNCFLKREVEHKKKNTYRKRLA